jgi:hypothetical protein
MRLLDFGDDSLYSKRREQYEEKLKIIQPLDLANFPFRVDSERLKQGIWKSKGEKKSFIETIVAIPDMVRIKHDEIGPLIDSFVSSVSLVRDKNVDAQTLWRRGITMKRLLKNGYNLNDLIIFRTKWYDMRQLQFTADDWRDNKAALPPEDMINVFGISIHDVLQICEYDLKQYAKIQFTVQELRQLQTSSDVLFNLPTMDKDVFMYFELSMDEWNLLGLKFEHMKKIGLEKNDLKEMGWITTEKEKAQMSKFSSLFGKSADLLKTHKREIQVRQKPPTKKEEPKETKKSGYLTFS